MQVVNPTFCPLCGATNQCAMEIAKATGKPLERCWCVDTVFTPELLEWLPEATKGKACVCVACSSKANLAS